MIIEKLRGKSAAALSSAALALAMLAWAPMQAHAQVGQSLGSCPATAFITRDAGGTNHLFDFNLATGAQVDQGTNPDMINVNAIGFRQQDGYIWGWSNSSTNRLVRIGAGGVADLPYAAAPAGLPAGAQFFAADVTPAGLYVGVYTGTATNPLNQLWTINVTTNTVVGTVTLSQGLGTDIAFHPTDNNLYSVSGTGVVMRVNPTTGAVTVLPIILPNLLGGGFGGLFFDSQGTLYAYRAGAGIVYRVFNVDGTGTMAYDTLTTGAPTAMSLDSARCPSAPPQGAPAVLLTKTTVGQVGGPFNFVLNNTVQTSGSATTTAVGTAIQVDGDTATAGLQAFTVNNSALGQPLTINESALPTGWKLTNASCTSNGTPIGSLAGATYTVPGAAIVTGALIQCNFTNTKQPILRLKKALPGGRLVAADQFTLTIAGTGGPATATTTGSTNAPVEMATLTTATIGSAYTLSETGASGANLGDYTSTYSCTNALAGGQTPSGNGTSFNLTPVAGDDLSCTFSNAVIPRADLAIVKTSSAATAQSGGLLNFTLTVTNNGPSAANGAVIRDMPGTGLDCTTPSTTASCTASVGAACPGATVPVADLLGGGGTTIPTLPVGGQVVFVLQCRVTATGAP